MSLHLEHLLEVYMCQNLSVQDDVGGGGRDRATSDIAVLTTMKLDSFSSKDGIYLHGDVKNEIGIGGSGDLQGPLTLRKHLVSDRFEAMRLATNCPCIHISIAGPYIQFSGSVFVEDFVVQPFTDYIYLGGDPYVDTRAHHVAKVFNVFRAAARDLRRYYEDTTQPVAARFLPKPCYTSAESALGGLQPLLRLQERVVLRPLSAHVLVRGEYDDKPALVKFTDRYGAHAHALLARAGLAPALYHHERLRDGLWMVVMEWLGDGAENAREAFSRDQALPDGVVRSVERALDTLHGAGMVFGDVRRQNVMVRECGGGGGGGESDDALLSGSATGKRWDVWLVDFDWAGKAGEARYDLQLNEVMGRPRGVAGGELIREECDMAMLREISPRFPLLYESPLGSSN